MVWDKFVATTKEECMHWRMSLYLGRIYHHHIVTAHQVCLNRGLVFADEYLCERRR